MLNSKTLAAISVASLFLMFGLTGCATYLVPAQTTPLPQTQLTAASIPDAIITERVHAALGDTGMVPASSIRVVTVNRRVCLYGVVGSYVQADEAARVTRTVDGVRTVDLYLTIVPSY